MPDISITSPEFTRAWQFLQDHLLHEIEAAEPEGREVLDIINTAIERAQARTAEDERRDAIVFLRAQVEAFRQQVDEFEDDDLALRRSVRVQELEYTIRYIERGDHVTFALKETP